jgi:penicillin G amidase
MKWLWRVLGVVLVLVLTVVASAIGLLRASLPDLDGTVVSAGLSAPASIARDAQGVPVIEAASRPDLAFATGVAHGQDRYFQMDLMRRQAAGELAALFGAAAVDVDRRHRLHRFRARALAVVAALPPAQREILERYTDGVNAGLSSLDARPFEYFVVGQPPMPWRAEDSILVVYTMFLQLNDERARDDVRRGLAARALPGSVYAWLYPDGTPWDAPLEGAPREPAPWPAPGEYDPRAGDASLPAAARAATAPYLGSNNWAVGGALTTSGRALVANDMHLGLSVPNVWYRARLVQTGSGARDVAGVTLPGTPLVVAGSNGRVAWAYTNSYGDWSDAVLLRPGTAPGTYRTPDGERPFGVFNERIEVHGADAVDFPVRETVWGPVDDSIEYPDGEIAVRWIAHHPEAVNLNLLGIETADSVDAALAIANTAGIPPQNFVVGDAAGNIGWTIAGRIPRRGNYEPTVPTDGSVDPGWSGWLEPEDYPRTVNPPGDRIWTANARVVDREALALIGDGGYDLGARAHQIRDALAARETFVPADMLAIQADDRALFLAPWRELLLETLDDDSVGGDDELRVYRDLVADWLPRAAPESVGYRLVRGFRLEVRQRVFDGLLAPVRAHSEAVPDLLISSQFEGPLWQLVTERPRHLLPAGYDSWHELLVTAVRANIEFFHEQYGSDLAGRNWGEINTLRMQHPLSLAVPALGRWLDMPAVPVSGDSNMPRAQGSDWGASERFAVSPGDEEHGLMQMPGGQSGHPLSDFYRAGHEAWLRAEPAPFLPGPARFTLKLEPASVTIGDSNRQ